MVGWHYRLNGHEYEQAPSDGEGQGRLVCYAPQGRKESDTTERLNNNQNYGNNGTMQPLLRIMSLPTWKDIHDRLLSEEDNEQNRQCMHPQSFQSCLTLCDPVDCSLPGSSVHGILQARILKWVVISSSRESSPPRNQTLVSCSSFIAGGFFTTEPPWKSKTRQLQNISPR